MMRNWDHCCACQWKWERERGIKTGKGRTGRRGVGGEKLTDDSVVQYVHNSFSAFSRDAVKID